MTKKQLHRRPSQPVDALPDSLHPLLRQLYAARGVCDATELERSLAKMINYRDLSGIEAAAALLYQALIEDKHVVIVGDFDADGATSTALAVLALNKMGFYHVDYLIPDRFEHGYGLSVDVVRQAIDKQAQLIITVDNGITSFEGVDYAHDHGIDVIITDHHLPGDTLPNADAIINPNLADCHFASKSLSGVGTTFYFMIALRAHLRAVNWFAQNQIPEFNLAELLDLVALGTVADVVPLDANNRILVHQGLNRIRSGCCRLGITALLNVSKRTAEKLNASDLGFALAPRLNAAGRLDNMAIGVKLLLCDDPAKAKMLAEELDALNAERKNIEQEMQTEALALFSEIEAGFDTLPCGIAIYHPAWHQGVIGILAARIKERFYRPVIAFASIGNGQIKGSARSISGLHMKDVLERIDTLHPDLLLSFGGHAMAAGMTLREADFERFKTIFDEMVQAKLTPEQLNNIILTDGELAGHFLTLETAEVLRQAGPWGQGFPEPLFDGKFRLLRQQVVAEKHLKMLIEPLQGGPMIDCIAFNVDRAQWPDLSVKEVELVYRLDVNEFRGNRSVQLMVEHLWAALH